MGRSQSWLLHNSLCLATIIVSSIYTIVPLYIVGNNYVTPC